MFSNYKFFTVCCAHVIAVATYLCMHAEQWIISSKDVRYLPIQDTEPFSDILSIQVLHLTRSCFSIQGSRRTCLSEIDQSSGADTTRSEKQRGFWKEMYTYIENTWRTHEQIISNYISIVRKNTLVLWHSFNYESQFKAALGLAGKYCVWKLKKKTPMIYTFWANSLFFPVKFALFCKFYIFSVNFTLFSVESVLFSIKFTHCPYIKSPRPRWSLQWRNTGRGCC